LYRPIQCGTQLNQLGVQEICAHERVRRLNVKMNSKMISWLRSGVVIGLTSALIAACASTPPASAPPSPDDAVGQDAPVPVPAATPNFGTFDPSGNPYVPGTNQLLARTFYFGYDQSDLSQNDLAILELHANVLAANRDRSISIQGHTDERGTREYNLALGEKRAATLRRFLVSAGVSSGQVEMISYGEERPEDAGHNESSWSRNRRAIVIYR